MGAWALGLPEVRDRLEGGMPVCLVDRELDRHVYLLGASGSGKSRLLELLIRQHLRQRSGLCLVDPHGDLTQSVLTFLHEEVRIAEQAGTPLDLERLYLVEPFAEDGIVGLNPLDSGGAPLHPHIGELVGIFRRVWASSWGPRMEELLRTALLTLAQAGFTLAELPALLTDTAFRSRVLEAVTDEPVRDYWTQRFDPLSDAARSAWTEPVLNKIGALLADPRLRAMLGQCEGTLDLRRLMDQGAWLLVNCSKGQLRDASHLLGSLFVAQLQAAALSRADLPEAERHPFTLFVDEFQNFRGEDFETILCEARKYRLRLVLAHQHLGQLDPALQNAIFGNVATHLFFAVSPRDAGVVARELADGGTAASELVHLPVGQALLHRRGQTPVRLRILPVLTPPVEPSALRHFAAGLRQSHGRPLAEVEGEMRRRLAPPPATPPMLELQPAKPSMPAKQTKPSRARPAQPRESVHGDRSNRNPAKNPAPPAPSAALPHPIQEADDD